MPPLSSRTIPIDPEWAEYLVGLRLNVPSHWWPDFDGDEENLGTILAVTFMQTNQRCFQLLLDSDEGKKAYYSMRYDAILAFVDVNKPLFQASAYPVIQLQILKEKRSVYIAKYDRSKTMMTQPLQPLILPVLILTTMALNQAKI